MKAIIFSSAKHFIVTLTAAFIGLLSIGCQSTQAPTGELTQVGPTPISTAISVAQPTSRPLSTAADTISSQPQPTVITLTVWATEGFTPQSDLVAEQLSNFETDNPNVKVKIHLKNSSGQASALNYLRSAKEVAPGVLPDLVILDTGDLPYAWRENLIQPLNDKLDRTIVQDLLPAALKLGAVDGQLAGMPFELDLEHLVYNTTLITDTPLLWTDVLSSGVSYQFPAKGRAKQLGDASLSHYVSAGARLVNEEGAAKVDEAALLDTLNFYQHALEQEIINADILNVSESYEQWEQFLSGEIGMTHVSAHRYLTDRRMLSNARPGAIPSAKGAPVAIGHGWVFALVTSDPARQKHALKLIETFMQTDVNANWATRSAVIPTRQSAFYLVANDDPYWLFLSNYLQAAIPQPAFEGFDQLSRALQQAVEQVINKEASPDKAVQNAVADLE